MFCIDISRIGSDIFTFLPRSKTELFALQWFYSQVAACGVDLARVGFEVL
jgi:hypothetical protein